MKDQKNFRHNSMRKFSLGISPCPNDTFMFYHLLRSNYFNQPDQLSLTIADIEQLNTLCLEEKLDFSKVSFYAFAALRGRYSILSAGNAIGHGCGPLIVAREKVSASKLSEMKVAIPGKNTTAYLLLQCFVPDAKNVIAMPFGDIMPAVRNGEIDAGLIIHESRFTFEEQGLRKVLDLGEVWSEKTNCLPLPLGGIISKNSLPYDLVVLFNKQLADSVIKAYEKDWDLQKDLQGFVKKHSREISDEVVKQHIKTYVNDDSIQLSELSKSAITYLFKMAESKKLIPESRAQLFAED